MITNTDQLKVGDMYMVWPTGLLAVTEGVLMSHESLLPIGTRMRFEGTAPGGQKRFTVMGGAHNGSVVLIHSSMIPNRITAEP